MCHCNYFPSTLCALCARAVLVDLPHLTGDAGRCYRPRHQGFAEAKGAETGDSGEKSMSLGPHNRSYWSYRSYLAHNWHSNGSDQVMEKFSGSNSKKVVSDAPNTHHWVWEAVGSQGNTSLKLYIFWQGAAPSGTSSGTYFTQEPTPSRAK